MNKYYTFGMQLKFNDKDLQNFLVAISSSINELGEVVVGHKIEPKYEDGQVVFKITVDFSDGTKMTFVKKMELKVDLEFLSLTEEELAATMIAQGLAVPPEEQQLQPAIGFAIPTDDDFDDDDEE